MSKQVIKSCWFKSCLSVGLKKKYHLFITICCPISIFKLILPQSPLVQHLHHHPSSTMLLWSLAGMRNMFSWSSVFDRTEESQCFSKRRLTEVELITRFRKSYILLNSCFLVWRELNFCRQCKQLISQHVSSEWGKLTLYHEKETVAKFAYAINIF